MCKVIAVSNQKGGVGKTVSCVNLGIGLAQEGKKVLLIDGDPQGSLTISLGYEEPDEMEYSLATLMMNIVNDEKLNIEKTILHHKEGVDLIPANIELSAIEVSLVNAMSRELILRSMVEKLRDFYDFIIIDCMPSLGMMTINALACADSVLIPVQAAYLPVKGLQQLIKTIGRVKKQLNSKLKIEGILLTMVDNRTNYARDISLMVYDTYSASIKVFGTEIPMSVRASEVSVEGGSIYSYDPSVTYKLKLSGGDIKAVQGDSGHAQADMVTEVYGHILDEDRKKNAQLIEDAFYKKENLNPDMKRTDAGKKKIEVPGGIDAEALMKVLNNPEMAALLAGLAKGVTV